MAHQGSPAPESVRKDAFLGRQPIYDRELMIYGYELLFRSGAANQARFLDGDQATFTVLCNTLLEFGLARLVGRHRAFINLTRNAILSGYPRFFAPHQIIIEVLEDVAPEEDVLAALRDLKQSGYRIALDDCIWRPELEPFLELADLIKIDVMGLSEDALREQVRRFPGQQLLAEKVETREEFELCKALGFDYFQGYFISRPKIVSIEHVPASQVATLRLLSLVNDERSTPEQIAEVIRQDPGLAFRLLRLVNSSAYGIAVRVESIAHAVMLLGIAQLKSWTTLLALSGRNDIHPELLAAAMLRAKACEELGLRVEESLRERAFMTGLFSMLDALLGIPLETALLRISVVDEVADALVSGEGFLGQILACAIACERGDLPRIHLDSLDDTAIQECWLASLQWVDDFRRREGF